MRLKLWSFLNKTAAISFGVLLAIFIVVSHESDDNNPLHEKDSTEQSEDTDDSDSQVLISSDWVTSITSNHLQPVLNWIRNIELPENPVIHVYKVLETGTTEFFQTLFQRIISPNAP